MRLSKMLPICLGWPKFSFYHNFDYSSNDHWPTISIITPSYNQGKFLEQTMLSVFAQKYPSLEYIVIDGGSSDNSVQIIKKYEDRLKYWISEKDKGQSDAINKGMKHATGEWVAWINSDDYYLPNAFGLAMSAALKNKEAGWLVGETIMSKIFSLWAVKKSRFKPAIPVCESWLDFICTKRSLIELPQPSSFWKRTMWEKAGGLDLDFHYAMDHEIYGRFAHLSNRPHLLAHPLTIFRLHNEQKTTSEWTKFGQDELKVVDKWLSFDLSLQERSILLSYKTFLSDKLQGKNS
jgi:glycosyltransferase involved in cell wall biosynthesis